MGKWLDLIYLAFSESTINVWGIFPVKRYADIKHAIILLGL